jgi:hypothetical protein
MVKTLIKRALRRIGFSEEGAEAVAAWAEPYVSWLIFGKQEKTPKEIEDAEFERKTPPLNS